MPSRVGQKLLRPPANLGSCSTMFWKMAVALRFRRNWASMRSRWGSHREVATDVGADGL